MSDLKFEPAVRGLECIHQGKVRDTFAIPGRPDLLLTVATDRVSTHNVVHESIIPGKGAKLTTITVFMMNGPLSHLPNHLVAWDENIFDYLPEGEYPEDLADRALVIEKLDMIPIEFIYRSRMAGSLWKDFYSKGLPNPYGILLPPGLTIMSPFSETIFTPTEKSATDDPLDAENVKRECRGAYDLSREAYEIGYAYGLERDIGIIDGKFEVGLSAKGELKLGDESLTPDCCRFVEADEIEVGREPSWLDKQFIREEAERMWAGGKKVPLTFSLEAIEETSKRYERIVHVLTA